MQPSPELCPLCHCDQDWDEENKAAPVQGGGRGCETSELPSRPPQGVYPQWSSM